MYNANIYILSSLCLCILFNVVFIDDYVGRMRRSMEHEVCGLGGCGISSQAWIDKD